MGVRRTENDLVWQKAVLLLQRRADVVVHVLRKTQQITRQDDAAMACGVFERKGLHPKLHRLAVGRLGAVAKARHPQGFLRRDERPRHTGFPGQLRGGQRVGGHQNDES